MTERAERFTRRELVQYLEGAFAGGGANRDEALEVLIGNRAPAGLVALFRERVPAQTRLQSVRALWDYFGDLPLEREAG
jgi:hypothetical protein